MLKRNIIINNLIKIIIILIFIKSDDYINSKMEMLKDPDKEKEEIKSADDCFKKVQ